MAAAADARLAAAGFLIQGCVNTMNQLMSESIGPNFICLRFPKLNQHLEMPYTYMEMFTNGVRVLQFSKLYPNSRAAIELRIVS